MCVNRDVRSTNCNQVLGTARSETCPRSHKRQPRERSKQSTFVVVNLRPHDPRKGDDGDRRSTQADAPLLIDSDDHECAKNQTGPDAPARSGCHQPMRSRHSRSADGERSCGARVRKQR